MSYEVIIDGPINLSGMGNLTRGFIKALNEIPEIRLKIFDNRVSDLLAQSGLTEEEMKLYDDLSKVDVSTNALYLQIGSPRDFKRVPFKHNIGYTLFESDGFHPFYVHQANQKVDELWTASKFNKHTFSSAGVTQKIRVIPPVVDTEIYKPGIDRLNIKNLRKYVFQTNIDFSWRKGLDKLLHAFWDEFTDQDDVCLLVKIFSGTDKPENQQQIMNNMKFTKKKLGIDDKKTAPVLFFGAFLGQDQMPAFSNTCDCYVMPSRGEGFGLTLAEAMSLEKQCICTRWSAPVEFINKRNGYLLDLDASKPLEPIQDQYQLSTEPYYQGQSMSNPSTDHLKQLLHKVIEDKDNEQLKKKARENIVKKFSKDVVKETLKNNIIEVFEGRKLDTTANKGLF